MELGNLLFGNSRGRYPVDHSTMDKAYKWKELCDKAGIDNYGCYNGQWGDSYNVYEGFKNDTFQVFPYFWGECEDVEGYDDSADGDCGECAVKDCLVLKPNFTFFPQNVTLSWYKYPWRDSYANNQLTVGQYNEIFQQCIDSLTLDEEQKKREQLVQELLSNSTEIFFSVVDGKYCNKQQFLTCRFPVRYATENLLPMSRTYFRSIRFGDVSVRYASSALSNITEMITVYMGSVEKFSDELSQVSFVSDLD